MLSRPANSNLPMVRSDEPRGPQVFVEITFVILLLSSVLGKLFPPLVNSFVLCPILVPILVLVRVCIECVCAQLREAPCFKLPTIPARRPTLRYLRVL